MGLLNTLGYHIQLTKVDSEQKEKMLFPVNTSDDVVVNEDGDSLSTFLPTITNDVETPTKVAPLTGLEKGSIEISDAELAALNA